MGPVLNPIIRHALTINRLGRGQRLHGRPGRLPASDDAHNLYPMGARLEGGGDAVVDLVVEALHRFVGAREVEALTRDGHLDGVGEVGVEDARVVAAGEDCLNLVRVWVGAGHCGFVVDDDVSCRCETEIEKERGCMYVRRAYLLVHIYIH